MSSACSTVLVVDDVPENLAVAHDALEAAGYLVRVATGGLAALASARRQPPDLILLDAMMPGLDGFETCRRLKADLATRPIPVIFMTGLSDTDDVVRGFAAGGIDYLTKPIRIVEMLARLATHLSNARLVAETQAASDAAGDALLAVEPDGRVRWASPLARAWLLPAFGESLRLPDALLRWLAAGAGAGAGASASYALTAGAQRLAFARLGDGRLLVQRREAVPEPEVLGRALALTVREAEVLHWVALGKTNPEIAQVLDMSPRTVNKHLEHIFTKLGVETRTAATTVALERCRLGVAPT